MNTIGLLLRNDLFRSAIEQVPASIVITDNQGNIEYVNPFFTENTGYSFEEALGQNPRILKSGKQSKSDYERLWNTITSGNTWHGELQNKRKDGTLFWEKVSISSVKNKANEITNYIAVKQDITKEKESEEVLRHSESKFRAVVNAFDDIVFLLDDQGRHTDVFGNWVKPEQRSDYIGKNAFEILGDEASRIHMDAFRKAIKGEHILYNWSVENGEKKQYYQTQLSPIYKKNGDVQSILGVGRNVTKELNAQMNLSEARERLNYALEGTKAGTWDWNVKTGKTIYNERWAEIIGYSLPELEPYSIITWQNLTHPDDLPYATEKLQEYFNGKSEYYDVKFRMKHKEGHWVWVWDRGDVFERDENGEPLRMVGTHVDITEWMVAKEKLAISEKRYRELFERSTDPSLIEQGGKFTDCNVAAVKLLGYESKKDIIGKSVLTFSPKTQENGKTSKSYFTEVINNAINNGNAKFEWIHLKKDGEEFPVEVMLTNIPDENDLDMRYVVWRDISLRKKAEKKLLKAYEERGILLSEIHHRVKNNLAIISGLMQLQMFNATNENDIELLSKSVNRIKAIALIHEQLYSSSDFAQISLNDNIDKLAESIRSMFSDKLNANVTIDLDLHEVLININQALPVGLLVNEILSNAFKHAFKGRNVGVIRISLSEHDNEIHLKICDDGNGAKEEEIIGTGSLGQTLIGRFIQQLNATVEMKLDQGVCYFISFKKQDLKGSVISNHIL